MSFLMVLFLIFMVLKLCGVITWSWWLVCLPLIIQVIAIVVKSFIETFIAKKQ